MDGLRESALGGLVRALALQLLADIAGAAGIHGALEGVTLPAKDVVSVLGVPRPAGPC